MTKEDEYRVNAAETVDLANRASTTRDKGRLLGLAEKWLDLADRTRAHHRADQALPELGEHPLVRSKLGTDTDQWGPK